MRHRRWKASVLALAAAIVLGSSAADPRSPAAASWRLDPVWDDGQAEFCAYEATWARYGHLYRGRVLLVLVKEPWAPDLDVKADTPRADGFEVLKLNHLRDVPTGIYTYHQMASLFWRRTDGALQKIAAASQEACGISTADMTRGQLRTRSYFDGQGDRVQRWPQGAVPEDGLPVALRDYIRGPVPAQLQVFPSLLMGRFRALQPVAYRLTRRDLGDLTVPAGTFPAVEMRLERGTEFLAYAFEARPGGRLLRFQRDDGTEYQLARADRIAYWEQHAPGDEAWLPEAVR